MSSNINNISTIYFSTKNIIVDNLPEFYKYICNDKLNITNIHCPTEELCEILYKDINEEIKINKNTNIFIACFTTAYTRFKLYDLLDKLGENVLYYDTDTVIFVENEENKNIIKIGNYLGELTNELPNDAYITEFISTGPKSYGYKLSNEKINLKIKGFTLNYESFILTS